MRTAGSLWCSDLDRKTIASERRFRRLIIAETYGFCVRSERDAIAALSILDEWRPYHDHLVVCEAPLQSRIVHPNIAVAFRQSDGLRGFQNAIASGTNAVLRVCNVTQAANAYILALQERSQAGLPIFAIRAVFSFESLDERDVATFHNIFRTSNAFNRMRVRGARIPRLLSSKSNTLIK
jgi:hypothetical protein